MDSHRGGNGKWIYFVIAAGGLGVGGFGQYGLSNLAAAKDHTHAEMIANTNLMTVVREDIRSIKNQLSRIEGAVTDIRVDISKGDK